MNLSTQEDTQPLSLEDVQQQFSAWRASRRGRTRLPDRLWQQVFTLLAHYPRAQVLRTLGIKSERLTAKLASSSATPPELSFVAIPVPHLPSANSPDLCKMELTVASAPHVTLHIPWPHVAPLLQTLWTSSCCK